MDQVNGWKLSATFQDQEPRLMDLDLGGRLGYSRAIAIRNLIRNLIKSGKLSNVTTVFESKTNGIGRARKECVYHLTEVQTVIVITNSGTPTANALTREVAEVFVAWRHGKLHPPAAPELSTLLTEIRALRTIVEAMQSGPAAATGAISPTQYRALRSDAAALARWEHRAGLATSPAAARASIDQDLRSRTGWGGKARPWTTLPAHLLPEARTALRERMQRMRERRPEVEQLELPHEQLGLPHVSKAKH